MASEIIYVNTNFRDESHFSDTSSASPPDPQQRPTHKGCHSFSKFLLVIFMIYFLLLTIIFSVASIPLFQKYSQILKEKATTKGLNYTELECSREPSAVEDQIWGCCPKSWKPFSSDCYFISPDSRSWSESRESCTSMEAHLLVIRSKEQQDSITMNLDIRTDFYVGLSDPEGRGQWQWVDQTPYNPNAVFWHRNEPNTVDERCVVINNRLSRKWGWNDVFCNISHRFICQMKKIYL